VNVVKEILFGAPQSRCAARKAVLLLGLVIGSGVRSFANNLQHALLILGAVIVKLVREVRDKAPCWHRNGQ